MEKDDVKEAMRLMEMSKDSLNHHDQRPTRYDSFVFPFFFIRLNFFSFINLRPTSAKDQIYALVRDLAGENKVVKMSAVVERCTTKGFTPAQVDECVEEYEELNVWQVNQTRTTLTFV